MHDPSYVKMPNATHAKMQLNRLGFLRWHMNATNDTCFEIRIPVSVLKYNAVLNDAPSPVHAIQMNDARMQA